ncbi:putative entry exclusion protein TrbK-alt [Ruegeria sp. HKCCD8929]|uniref:putative entry exclusion protein TrbK-alt n=1 Tax=Ruegeria sp. HKCCD8929 TaxID=2683006 RepID=UPI001488CA12|nr:putative entry exclusion protein TrbK-alt [Ruegeria sp. HKCCD8929]
MQITAPRILRIVALGLGGLAILAAMIELSRNVLPDKARPVFSDDPLRATLARCRDTAAEDYASDAACRAAWAEVRRHFLQLPSDPDGTE